MKTLFLALFSIQAFAFSPVQEEAIYRKYIRQFAELGRVAIAPGEDKLALDAVEDSLAHGAGKLGAEPAGLAPAEQVRWVRLQAKYGSVSGASELRALRLARAELDSRMKQELRLLRPLLKSKTAREEIAQLLPDGKAKEFSAPSAAEVKSLFNELPNLAGFQGGKYAGWPRIFVFCRHDHNYGCLLAMRDRNNAAVREGGKLWLQPALGLSDRGLPYDQRNGNTPQGVQLVDGVMPVADMPVYYGKFRRMVLNFAPASEGEVEQKKLFPRGVSDWWREAVVARDMGRNLLRIHGVGELNPDPASLYYPFIPTIGCLAQREGKYPEEEYIDQRKLLDHWMAAAGLEVKYDNEPSIRGLMYFIEINDEPRVVTREDLRAIGIY